MPMHHTPGIKNNRLPISNIMANIAIHLILALFFNAPIVLMFQKESQFTPSIHLKNSTVTNSKPLPLSQSEDKSSVQTKLFSVPRSQDPINKKTLVNMSDLFDMKTLNNVFMRSSSSYSIKSASSAKRDKYSHGVNKLSTVDSLIENNSRKETYKVIPQTSSRHVDRSKREKKHTSSSEPDYYAGMLLKLDRNYTPKEIAEYIFTTGDEKGIAQVIADMIQDGQVMASRDDVIFFLETVQREVAKLQSVQSLMERKKRPPYQPA